MIGRFISADTVVPDPLNPQSHDRYSYCQNNPLKYVDPSGHVIESVWDVANIAMDVASLVDNIKNGNYGAAVVDVVGLAIDVSATALPGIPGGAGSLIKSKRIAKAVKKLDNAGGGKNPVCFAAGTLIHTADGLVPIEIIRVNDLVLSRSEETGDISYRKVLQTKVTLDAPILELNILDDNGKIESFKTTADHPFWVKGKKWVDAEKLKVEDEVLSNSGALVKVSSGTWLSKRQTVYNFEVEEFHTYFIGETGVWVHNSVCVEGVEKGTIKAAAEARQKTDKLNDFKPDKTGRSPGHARSKHGWKVNDPKVLDIRNNPDKIYVGTNKNGNKVTIFYKDGNVVITDAADTKSVITAYGKDAPKKPSYQKDKWEDDPNYSEIK